MLKTRTKQAAIATISLVESLPKAGSCFVIGRQLLRSSTSVGANYRAACRAKSRADMIHKLSIVEEEADESLFWLELLSEAGLVKSPNVTVLAREYNEILAMTVASIKKLKRSAALQTPNSKIQIQKDV